MDLPERLSGRVNSRVKNALNRIVFQPYTFKEVHEILLNRLGVLELDIFRDGAMEFLARRASTVAGTYVLRNFTVQNFHKMSCSNSLSKTIPVKIYFFCGNREM